MNLKKDRLVAGSIAGSIGALIQAIYGITVKALKLTDRAFIDFSKTFMMYKNYTGFFADMMGLIVHLVLGAFWGVIFAYLIQFTSSRYYYYKAFGYGAFLWLGLGIVGTTTRIPLFTQIPPYAVLSTFIGGLVFGVSNAYALKWLERKTSLV